MLKNWLLAIGAVFLLTMSFVYADDTVNKPYMKNGSVVISGRTEQSFLRVSAVVISADGEETLANVKAVGETASDKDGNFKLEFVADDEKSLWNDGDCKLIVRINEKKYPVEFYYYSEDSKNTATENFIKYSELREQMLSESSDEYKIFCALGIKLDALKQTQTAQLLGMVDGVLNEQMTEAEFITAANKCIAVLAFDGGEANADLLSAAYPEFAAKTEEERAFILTAMEKNRQYADTAVLDAGYKKACVLYSLNCARYDEIKSLLADNADSLGIGGDSVYVSFTSLSSARQGKTAEKLSELLKNDKAYTVSGFLSKLEAAVLSTAEYDNTPSGGGGGGSSGSSSVPIVITTESVHGAPFGDLADAGWAREAVTELYKRGIVNGVSEKLFEPNRAVKREEFVTMLVKAAGLEAKDCEMSFADVAEGGWYYESVKAAYSNGAVSGISEDMFGAGLDVTREDTAVMVYRLFADKIGMSAAKTAFTDADEISEYALESVAKLCAGGIISGMGDGSFNPKGTTTRAQAAVVIYRVLRGIYE